MRHIMAVGNDAARSFEKAKFPKFGRSYENYRWTPCSHAPGLMYEILETAIGTDRYLPMIRQPATRSAR